MSASYVWSGNFCSTNLEDRLVALVVDNGKYYSFAKTGKVILQLLETPKSLDELVTNLTATYNVPRETCMAETAEFLTVLEEGGLIKKVS